MSSYADKASFSHQDFSFMNSRHIWILMPITLFFSCAKSEPVALPPGKKVSLINAKINNGSFEDWTDAYLSAPHKDGSERLLNSKGTVRIPYWTLKSNNLSGFDNTRSTSHLRSYAFGNRQAFTVLISDPCGVAAGFTEGTVISLSYDQMLFCKQKDVEKLEAQDLEFSEIFFTRPFLVFDGGDDAKAVQGTPGDGTTASLGEIKFPADYASDDVMTARNLTYNLTKEDAIAANASGIRVLIKHFNRSSGQYRIDNLRLSARKPGS